MWRHCCKLTVDELGTLEAQRISQSQLADAKFNLITSLFVANAADTVHTLPVTSPMFWKEKLSDLGKNPPQEMIGIDKYEIGVFDLVSTQRTIEVLSWRRLPR